MSEAVQSKIGTIVWCDLTLEEAETYRGLDYRLTWFLMHWLG